MDESPTDAALVERTLAGDPRAFDSLTRRYLRPALATAWEFSDSLADAEDIVQEAFVRALEALGSFDAVRPFAPWFFAILRNVARNDAARRGRWRFVPVPERLDSGAAGPEAELDASEIRDALSNGLDRLTPMQRASFRLCDVEGFGGPEAADMLGVSHATVRVHLHRARRTLREVLRPLHDGSGVP